MIALKAIDLRNDFKRVSDLVTSGEVVFIARPRNENLVVMSEKEYNRLDKAHRNVAHIAKTDRSLRQLAEGKSVSFTVDELEAMENMSAEETQALIVQARERQRA